MRCVLPPCVSFRYAGHVKEFDELVVEGDLSKYQFVAYYIKDDKVTTPNLTHSPNAPTVACVWRADRGGGDVWPRPGSCGDRRGHAAEHHADGVGGRSGLLQCRYDTCPTQGEEAADRRGELVETCVCVCVCVGVPQEARQDQEEVISVLMGVPVCVSERCERCDFSSSSVCGKED